MIRDHDQGTDGPFALSSPQLESKGARRVVEIDDVGTHHGYAIDGQIVARALITPSAARAAELATEQAAYLQRLTKRDNQRARLLALGTRAARFAKDPVANAADSFLNDAAGRRLLHELLARLAIAEASEEV